MKHSEGLKKINVFAIIFFLACLLFPGSALATRNFTDDALPFLEKTVDQTGVVRTDVRSATGLIINRALTLVGLLFFVLMVYGGFLWITARGKEEQIEKARNVIIASLIGIAIIVASYALTNFITSRAIDAGTSDGPTP